MYFSGYYIKLRVKLDKLLFFSGIAQVKAKFGEGSDDILVESFECIGVEESLFDCKFKTKHDCDHDEDAGVVCYNGKTILTNI